MKLGKFQKYSLIVGDLEYTFIVDSIIKRDDDESYELIFTVTKGNRHATVGQVIRGMYSRLNIESYLENKNKHHRWIVSLVNELPEDLFTL